MKMVVDYNIIVQVITLQHHIQQQQPHITINPQQHIIIMIILEIIIIHQHMQTHFKHKFNLNHKAL